MEGAEEHLAAGARGETERNHRPRVHGTLARPAGPVTTPERALARPVAGGIRPWYPNGELQSLAKAMEGGRTDAPVRRTRARPAASVRSRR